MTKRIGKTKQKEILTAYLLAKIKEYKSFKHQKLPKKDLMIKTLIDKQLELNPETNTKKAKTILNKEKSINLIKQMYSSDCHPEVAKFRDWYQKEYKTNSEADMWQKPIILEYILCYQIWAIRKNQNSKETKHIYRREAIWFSKYLAHKYKANDYRKIQNKHIESYVKSLIEKGLKPITIQKKMYGIYYYHTILYGTNELKSIKEVIQSCQEV